MSPFSKNPETQPASRGESGLIRQIQKVLADCSPPPPEGIGDDCAVIPLPATGYGLHAIDPVVFGRHFDDKTAPERVGAKLLKRNLSDIAAMGGTPVSALLALTLAPDACLVWLDGFCRGLSDCAIKYHVKINGGDIAQGPPGTFAAHLSIFGHASQPVPRLGGRPGDTLWVTGNLGGSLSGKHLDFEPRLAEGRWLASQADLRGMIDITDGLAKDLVSLLPSEGSALLDVAAIPLAEGVTRWEQAFTDGEDYELAFAMDSSVDPVAFLQAWRQHFNLNLTMIGRIGIRAADGPTLVHATTGEACQPGPGYEHF